MSEDEAQKLWEKTIRMDGRLEALENNWAELRIFMDSVTKELGRLSSYNIEVASGLRKTVYGNGSPGLATVVTQLVERTDARKALHDRDMCKVDQGLVKIERVLYWSGSAFVLTLLGIIGYLFSLHFGG